MYQENEYVCIKEMRSGEVVQSFTMSRNVKNNFEVLQALVKMNPKQRANVLKDADSGLIIAICECALNTLKGNVPLTPAQKKKLSRFRRLLHSLVHQPKQWKSKRKLLVQKGGAAVIPVLLGAVVSSLLSHWLK